MKFKLGQKVRYKRITKHIKAGEKYLKLDDFVEGIDEEKMLERRESIELMNERTGHIMGRRRFVFKTYLGVEVDNGDGISPGSEWVDIKKQEYGYAYQVAYDMGHTNYVLEEDLN